MTFEIHLTDGVTMRDVENAACKFSYEINRSWVESKIHFVEEGTLRCTLEVPQVLSPRLLNHYDYITL